MTISAIDKSRRKAARVAGFTFLFAMAIVIVANYGINFRLIIPGNTTETARNILAHETLFRINLACNLFYVVTVIVMLTTLYIILKPVNQNLALIAVFFRLIYALMWGVTALNTLDTLRLLGYADYLPVFKTDQLQTLARLHLTASWDAYYFGLPFWGLASALCSYLWFKSRYIPRALAAFGVISSVWCVICAIIFIIFPNFDKTINLYCFDTPMLIFEMILGFVLLFKGLGTSGMLRPNPMTQEIL
jgi:hypothetical protein